MTQALIDPETRQCPEHPGQPLRCAMCLSEWKGDKDAQALAAREAIIQHFECVDRFPRRWQKAKATHPEVLAWVEKWNELGPEACPSLLLLGLVGRGKTHEAYGALRGAVTGPRPAKWEAVTASNMLADLRQIGSDADKAAARRAMTRFCDVELLLIDELAVGKSTEWVEETFLRIVDGRYAEMAPTIYTANLLKKEVKEVLGDRIASRFVESCDVVVLDGEDRRRQGRAS